MKDVTYIIVHPDGRAVFQDVQYGRMYVRGREDFSPDMKLYRTQCLECARSMLEITNTVWSGFEIKKDIREERE